MTQDIRSILERMTAIEGRLTPVMPARGLNPQQKSVDQLPALFRPRSISPTLTKKPYQKHPMDGKLVGGESAPTAANALEEAMQDVEEDVLSRVKRDLTNYLDKLEKEAHRDDGQRERDTPELDKLAKKSKLDRDLVVKAKDAVEKHQAEEEVAEDPTQQELSVHTPPQPQVNPTLPEAAPIKTYEMYDGTVLEAHGDEHQGFELRRGGRSLPTRFDRLDHADMAVKLYQRRQAKQDLSQDYIEER
jgi:hypothetical protein